MIQLQAIFAEISALFANLFMHPDWRNLVDIAILSIAIYNVIKLVMHTRANSLFKGIVLILLMAWLSDVLQISALSWVLQQIINMGFIIIAIVFQPELRRALDQIGRSKWASQIFSTSKTKKQSSGNTEKHVTEMVRALTNMSRKKIGALIVFERNTGLGDVIESGTMVDAQISQPLIENIFEPNTPLHDGAMIIREERIVAAACILQLSDDYSISRELGTRHRAAIGVTESTDAVSLIVSEETGIISMARDGKLTRYLDAKSLTILLTELFSRGSRQAGSWRDTVHERLGSVSTKIGSARKKEGRNEE